MSLKHLSEGDFERLIGWSKTYKPMHGQSSVYRILASLLEKFNPEFVFEIGTCAGSGTVVLAKHTRSHTRIYTVDIAKGMSIPLNSGQEDETLPADKIGYLIDEYGYRNKVVQLLGDSKKLEAGLFQWCDLVFIDGNHSEEYVRSDSNFAFDLVPDVIVWHDLQLPQVRRVVQEFAKDNDIYQVDVPSIDSTLTAFYIRGKGVWENIE